MSTQLDEPIFALAVSQLANGQLIIFRGRQSGMDVSRNRGRTWTTAWSETLVTALTVSPDFANDGLVVAGTHGGVIRSEDWGVTWHFHPLPLLRSLVTTLAMGKGATPNYLMLAGTMDDGIYRSTDRGLAWTASSTGAYIPRISAVHVIDDSMCLAGTDGGLFTSTTDGNTWDDELAEWLDADVTAVAGDSSLLVMGTALDGTYWCSTQEGTWNQLGPPSEAGEPIVAYIANTPSIGREVIIVSAHAVHRYAIRMEHDRMLVQAIEAIDLGVPITSATLYTSGRATSIFAAGVDGAIHLVPIQDVDASTHDAAPV